MTRLEEIKKRTETATSGPWESECRKENIYHPDKCWNHDVTCEKGEAIIIQSNAFLNEDHANAEFIAHARKDIPWLLDKLEDAIELIQFWEPGTDKTLDEKLPWAWEKNAMEFIKSIYGNKV